MARGKATEVKPDHPAVMESGPVVVTLDDGSRISFDTEADARAAHPRAWLRPVSEVDEGDDDDDASA